jgi:uncharacterized protein YbaP (TraB family)
MKRLFTKAMLLFFGLIILPCFSASAQDALLWKIYDNQTRGTSYIYGTIHVKDSRAFVYTDTVLCYLDSCDKLVLELDLNPMNLLQYSELMVLPADSTLADVFKPDDLVVIKEEVENITGMGFAAFERLKPVVLLSLVMQYQMKGDMKVTLDEFFYLKGIRLGKKIIGLETIEEQFRLLETIPLEVIVDYLKNPVEDEAEMELIICDYMESKVDELLFLLQKDETMVTLKKEFLDKRNNKMAEKIDKLMHEGNILVAVGAGHLSGENGIVSLLKRKGYIIEPVILKAPVNVKCGVTGWKYLFFRQKAVICSQYGNKLKSKYSDFNSCLTAKQLNANALNR